MSKSSVEPIVQLYEVPGNDFTRAGEASSKVKGILKKLGYDLDAIRRVSIAMYEGEINMVIHAHGGTAKVEIFPDRVEILLSDHGPGIADLEKAMEEGYSTAPDEVRALGFGAGMGLPNMKKCCDGLQINSVIGKGTDVYMTIRVRGTEG
ncbi:MAG: ATP-binding protein [Oscillospiraceae bacterium]